MVILAVMLSQLFRILEYFKLREVVLLLALLAHTTALFLTHVTEEMVFAVVDIQGFGVIEEFLWTKPTFRVGDLDVLLQGRVLIETLLEEQDWLLVQAQFTEVLFVVGHVVLS